MATIDKLNPEPRYLGWVEAYALVLELNSTEDVQDGWEYWIAPSSRHGYYHVAVYDEDCNFLGEL